MSIKTVSGNEPVEETTTPEPEETEEETTEEETEEETETPVEESEPEETTVTQNVTYTADNTAVCDLLSQLIAEVQKLNETNSKIYETMLLQHMEYLQSYEDSRKLFEETFVEETEVETETETETEPETETQTYEDFAKEQLFLIGENLEEINATVSGNNTLLSDLNETTETLAETYSEQTETAKTTTNQGLALGIGIAFVLALIAGLVIAKTAWGRMR